MQVQEEKTGAAAGCVLDLEDDEIEDSDKAMNRLNEQWAAAEAKEQQADTAVNNEE